MRVLVVEPGRFRTGLLSQGRNRVMRVSGVEDYAVFEEGMAQFLEGEDGRQPGDPGKAVGVVCDVVRGEGVAEGRAEMPFRLVLGEDAVDEIRGKCEGMLKVVGEWEGVARELDVEE